MGKSSGKVDTCTRCDAELHPIDIEGFCPSCDSDVRSDYDSSPYAVADAWSQVRRDDAAEWCAS